MSGEENGGTCSACGGIADMREDGTWEHRGTPCGIRNTAFVPLGKQWPPAVETK